MLDLGLSLDVWPWVWLVVGVACVLVELTVLGGSFLVLPFGVSAFIASLLAFSGVSAGVQWTVFLLGGGVLFLAFWRYQSLVQRGNKLPPGVGATRLVGLTGVVTRGIDPDAPEVRGEVRVGAETWSAVAASGTAIPAGATIRITAVEGTHVEVVPADPGNGDPPGADETPSPRPEGPS